MDTNSFMRPENLVQYAFYTTVFGLFLTAFLYLTSSPWLPFGYFYGSYDLFWLLAAVAAGYLLYMWFKSDRSIFGGNDLKDVTVFWFLIVMSINQGLLTTMHVGFYFASFFMQFGPLGHLLLAALYGYAGYYLVKRWKETNGGMVDIAPAPVVPLQREKGAGQQAPEPEEHKE